jgi:aldose 1-epimerase
LASTALAASPSSSGRSLNIETFALTGADGSGVRAIAYGAILQAIRVPDGDGRIAAVTLGYDSPADYLSGTSYFGAVVGRYGNRIAKGRFTLDGRAYQLATNNGVHGGVRGFDNAIWSGSRADRDDGAAVTFTHISADGDEGYPGTLAARVSYTWTPFRELVVDYTATTDAPTIVNLTQHSYFNLSGDPSATILDHRLTIDGDEYVPVDDALIPTGAFATVARTPFDFREPAPIGARIDTRDEQLRRAGGYDHCWVIRGRGFRRAARVVEPRSGRTLDVATTEPGLQFYSGNFLTGAAYRTGFCLETQHFPDSPNRPAFPSTVLRAGETYRSRTVFAFGVA